VKVTLNKLELKLAKYIGSHRYHNARDKGIEDRKMGDQSCEETDVEGAAAEIVFCKAYNLYPDLQFEVLLPHDAILHCGATVDVKHTKYDSGRLLATTKKIEHPCDIYVLVTGLKPAYEIRGGMPRELLFRAENIGDLGHGPGYMVEQDILWTVDQMVWRFEYGAV